MKTSQGIDIITETKLNVHRHIDTVIGTSMRVHSTQWYWQRWLVVNFAEQKWGHRRASHNIFDAKKMCKRKWSNENFVELHLYRIVWVCACGSLVRFRQYLLSEKISFGRYIKVLERLVYPFPSLLFSFFFLPIRSFLIFLSVSLSISQCSSVYFFLFLDFDIFSKN